MTKRVNITDVARLAGVSTATVSHYLNGRLDKMGESTRRRVERAVSDTGYVPNAQARSLTAKSSGVIAVLICNIANAWAGEVLKGIEGAARRNGYQTVVCDTGFDPELERMYVEKMLSLGVDGFVIQPSSQVRSVRNRLERAGKPVVFYDYSTFDLSGNWVKTDLYDAFYTAVSECVERGYEDFVLLAADAGGARTRVERMQGIVDALAAHGLAHRTLAITHAGPSAHELRRYVEYELNPARRTLLVVPHQWALARVCEAIEPMGHLIPHQIGILGIDNADWASLVRPSISTVVEPVREEGETALQMLVALMAAGEGDMPDTHRILKAETRWLGSTL